MPRIENEFLSVRECVPNVLPLFLLVQSLVVDLAVVHDIDVCAIHRFDIARAWIILNGHGSIDAGDGDSIACLHLVDHIVVREQQDIVRRLTGGHIVGRLLQLDHLLVGELRTIVHHLEAMIRVAVGAQSRLVDTATINLYGRCERAHDTLEEGFAHFGNDVRGANDHATDADQLVDVFGIEGAHVARLLRIEWTYLDLVLENSGRIFLEEHLIDGHIEGGNDFLRITDQLTVQRFVERLQMAAIDVQVRLFQRMDFFQFLHVKRFAQIDVFGHFVLRHVQIDVAHQEIGEFLLAFADHHICAPNDQLRLTLADRCRIGAHLADRLQLPFSNEICNSVFCRRTTQRSKERLTYVIGADVHLSHTTVLADVRPSS